MARETREQKYCCKLMFKGTGLLIHRATIPETSDAFGSGNDLNLLCYSFEYLKSKILSRRHFTISEVGKLNGLGTQRVPSSFAPFRRSNKPEK